jgi:hypothetical protein
MMIRRMRMRRRTQRKNNMIEVYDPLPGHENNDGVSFDWAIVEEELRFLSYCYLIIGREPCDVLYLGHCGGDARLPHHMVIRKERLKWISFTRTLGKVKRASQRTSQPWSRRGSCRLPEDKEGGLEVVCLT